MFETYAYDASQPQRSSFLRSPLRRMLETFQVVGSLLDRQRAQAWLCPH